MQSKNTRERCIAEGNNTETEFQALMESKGYKVEKTSANIDIHEHIDFYVNDMSVDVKGNRYLECIWLEMTNVRGKNGWLNGSATYIVMDIKELNQFIFFLREDLRDYCLSITDKTFSKYDFNKVYTRYGRKDEIIKVRYDDIKHLQKGNVYYRTDK